MCHQMLGDEADRRYGEHRLWASVGWGLMAAVSGYLVDLDSQDSLLYNYSWAFLLMLVFWTADILTVSRLELETKVKRRFAKVSIVSYSRPSLMIIAPASQFHVYLPWGQRPFSIMS